MHNLPTNISCNVTYEASIVVSTLSGVSYVTVVLLLLFYKRGDNNVNSFAHPSNLIVMFSTVLLSTVTTLSLPHEFDDMYTVYLIVLMTFIGIFVTLLGARAFFKVPLDDQFDRRLGFYHPDMSLIIWVITIPLVLMELIAFIGALTYKEKHKNIAAINGVGLLQKLIQASVYHFDLRFKAVKAGYKQGASWYLKTLSIFNFFAWLDSIVNAKQEQHIIQSIFGKGYSILTSANNALLIDYRLLCCLLFAEHALEIDYENVDGLIDDVDLIDDEKPANNSLFHVQISRMSGYGYVLGITIVLLQVICALQYANLVASWVNIFSIIADVLIPVLGIYLLKLSGNLRIKTFGKWRETNSKAVDIMVAVMGVTGFVFWVIKTSLNAVWAAKISNLTADQKQYLIWSCAKNLFRSIGILLQLYIFMKADPFIGCHQAVKQNIRSYFVLPALMLSLLATFITTVVDSYSGILEGLIATSGISDPIQLLLEAGKPLHLGFCLHVFLHFFIINNNMRTKKALVRRCASRPPSRMNLPVPRDGQPANQKNPLRRQQGIENNQALLEPLIDNVN